MQSAALLLCLAVLPVVAHGQVTVTVDPPDRLENPTPIANWKPAADGTLVAPVPNAGPDLDLGFNDCLQIRLKLPPGHTGDITFGFGTSTAPGFAPARAFSIPAASLARDGAAHTYRLDLGLVVWWRDRLHDLRVSTTGKPDPAWIAYAEVGDEPNSSLLFNPRTNFKDGLNLENTRRLESKHFCVWWDPNNKNFNPDTHARRAIRMCEESYQVYCKKLGYNEPFRKFGETTGQRYKLNIVTWHGGYWAGGYEDRPHLNVTWDGLGDEGWGNPIPHEFGHCIQMAQPGALTGGHWESHANYLRAQRNFHFAGLPVIQCSLSDVSPYSNFRPDHSRLIYADDRWHLPLDEYGKAIGLQGIASRNLWQGTVKELSLVEKLATMLPKSISPKDAACEMLKHWPLLDFSCRNAFRAAIWPDATARAAFEWKQGSMLVPRPDKPNRWLCPFERAPEGWGYMCHELTATPGASVTAELHGIDLPGTGEDWRWCLAAAKGDDTPRYSPVSGQGPLTFKLLNDESRLFLICVATPAVTKLDLGSFHDAKPWDKHPDRLRYAYEVRLENCAPAQKKIGLPEQPGATHANGGGFVARSAKVDATAFVGRGARVLDRAQVLGHARIEDFAVVSGDAVVTDDAIVSGGAWVNDNAHVSGAARIRDRALVGNGAKVKDRALVSGYAMVSDTTIQDDATVRGSSSPFGGTIGGTAIADYDYSMFFNYADGVGFSHVPWGEWFGPYCTTTLRKPRGLTASYRFDEPDGAVCWDEFGAQLALLNGTPNRANDDTHRSQILRLDGKSDYLILDRSLCDTRTATLELWAKPARGSVAKPLVFFGTTPGRYLGLTARDATGKAGFAITDGMGGVVKLSSRTLIPEMAWTHFAITLDGSNATLYINGRKHATAACHYTPLDLLAANTVDTRQANFIGHDLSGGFFAGDIEDVRIYNIVRTDSEIHDDLVRHGDVLGLFFTAEPKDFDGKSTTEESGVRNGAKRTLTAWVNPRATDGENAPLIDSFDEHNHRNGYGLALRHGQWTAHLDSGGDWDTGARATANTWQHVALSFDGKSAKLYVNGSEAAKKSYNGPANDVDTTHKNYRLGFSQANEDKSTRVHFNGQLRHVRIYDHALDAFEITRDTARDGMTGTGVGKTPAR